MKNKIQHTKKPIIKLFFKPKGNLFGYLTNQSLKYLNKFLNNSHHMNIIINKAIFAKRYAIVSALILFAGIALGIMFHSIFINPIFL